MNMIDHLVRAASVVLQDVVLLCARRDRELLGDRQQFGEVFVWKLVQVCSVVLGYDERVAFGERSDAEHQSEIGNKLGAEEECVSLSVATHSRKA